MARYRLKLKTLSFLSAVDVPAQETATALLFKRAGDVFEISGVAPVAKLVDELGLVFAWGWTSKVHGEDYVDLQNDVVSDGEDMIRAAAEFMANGGATDVMHDGAQDGRVIFAMPMNAEIATVYGIKASTTGFMVAVKPSAATYAKFKSGELTGLSLAGIGEREEIVDEKRKGAAVVALMKSAMLTSDDEGHSHLIDGDAASGTTSGADMPTAGQCNWHYHPFVRNEDGSFSLGAAYGHTHTAQTAASAEKAAGTITVLNSVSPGEFVRVLTPTEKAMTTDADRIKTLETELAKANETIAKFKEPPPAVVYKSADGSTFTAADDPRLVEMAKRHDASQVELADERIAKRAVEVCKHLGGTLDAKKAIVKALDSIADESIRKAAFEILAGADAAQKLAQAPIGKNVGTAPDGSATAKFEGFVTKYRESHKGVGRGEAITKLTTPGADFIAEAADAYEQMQAERTAAN